MPKQIDDADIFDATINAVLKHGYEGATTKMIAQTAKISEVTLFRKFGNKANLVARAIEYQLDPLKSAEVPITGDLEADLLGLVQFFATSSDLDSRIFPLIMSEMSRYPELKETMATPMKHVESIGKLMAHYQAQGVLAPENQFLAVGALLGPIILNRMLRTANDQMPIPPIDIPHHVRAFLHGRVLPSESG